MVEISHNSNDECSIRLQRLEEWYKIGKDPFISIASIPNNYNTLTLLKDFTNNPSQTIKGTVSGRIILKRDFGKAAFITIHDDVGDIQLYFKKDELGDKIFEEYKLLDLGDIISVTGVMFYTQKQEPTLKISDFQLLTKALRPLPEKFHGLEDIETRYRKRYLDLISHPDIKQKFIIRSQMIQYIREFLMKKEYIEVETPMMHPIVGGATARPFITHHNTLNMELYLRIAPELYLKRLVIGGMHKIFEINRNFRNEGIDSTHNPEFTMLELYKANSNWRGVADLFIELMKSISINLKGTSIISYQGKEVDIAKWKEISYSDALREKGINPDNIPTREVALTEANKYHLEIDNDMGYWGILAEIFDHIVSDYIVEPTIVYDYPSEISPLSKRKVDNPDLAERFEAYAFGMEISNGFSELNNPITQKEVFANQINRKKNGKEETMGYDEDYIEALEQGLPPTGGIGIGIDRLAMIFIDTASIRDVILFPTMKSK